MGSINAIHVMHSGGHLPIYAHEGWPDLKPHEVPFIGLDTERVLNTQETRDYEMGRNGGSSKPITYAPTYHFSAIDAKGMDEVLKEHLPKHEKIVRKMLTNLRRNGVRS